MLPRRLIIENFMGHRYSDIDCTLFNSCLIIGVNKNDSTISNGVGKSTIFYAIDYVLFDEYNSIVKNIIFDGADFCRITYEFELSGNVYQVIRRRGKTADIKFNQLIGDKWESKNGKTNSETETELHKLIKITYKAWKNSVLFSQLDLAGIPSVSSDKRKDLLKEPLQISVYNKYHKAAKTKLDNHSLLLNKNKVLIDNLGNPTTDILSISTEINNINVILSNSKTKNIELENSLNKKSAELLSLEKMLNSNAADLNKQLIETKNKIKTSQIDLNKNQTEFNDYNKKLNEFKIELSNKINSLQIKENNLKEICSEKLRTQEIIQNDLDFVIEKEQKGRVLTAKLEADKQNLSKPIPEIGECIVCFQEITNEHREKCINSAQTELNKVNAELFKYTDLLNKCILKRKNIEKEQKETAKKLSNIDYLKVDINNVKNNIDKSKEVVKQYESNIETKNKTINDLKESLENLIIQEKNLEESVKTLNFEDISQKILNVKKDINKLKTEINDVLQTISNKNTFLAVLEERKNNKEKDLTILNNYLLERTELEKKQFLYQKVVKAFSSHGIPTLIINTILDDLQIEANLVLSQLRPSMQFQFVINKDNEDDLDIIYKVHGKERDYNLLSGGQKFFIAISFKLGLAKIIQRRLGVDIRMLELDEVDRSLDEAGLEAFIEVIRKWQNDFKCFVITHNKNLKEKFNYAILVEGDDENGSTAKVVTNW
jgi:DNA repair exonuclease SbcCD ATPase subunit